MKYITKAFAEAVKELIRHQVPVIFVNGYPEGYCDGQVSAKERECLLQMRKTINIVGTENLAEVLRTKDISELVLEPADSRIRYRHYIHEDGTEIYLFVNEGTQVYRGMVQFSRQQNMDAAMAHAYQYDAWENKIGQISKKGSGSAA